MTNPSETRLTDNRLRELAEFPCKDAPMRPADITLDEFKSMARELLALREAADTIDRLTSSGEAVAWRIEGINITDDPARAEAWRHLFKGTDAPVIQPLYTHASPREGHVEDAEALRVAREVISDMVRYGHITTETGTTAYYVGENVLPTIMGRPLPHNQGETKPEAWDLAARAENGETNL